MAGDEGDDVLDQYYGGKWRTGNTADFLQQYEHSSPLEPYNAARTVADTAAQRGPWGVAKDLANAWASKGLGLLGGLVSAPLGASARVRERGPVMLSSAEGEGDNIGKDTFDAGSVAMAGAPFIPEGAVGSFGGKSPKGKSLELHHNGPKDLPGDKPTGDMHYFGSKDFSDAEGHQFGPQRYVYDVPTPVARKIVNLMDDTPAARQIMDDIGERVWGEKGIPVDEFYEMFADQTHWPDYFRSRPDLAGVQYGGEYLLPPSTIQRLRMTKNMPHDLYLDMYPPGEMSPGTHAGLKAVDDVYGGGPASSTSDILAQYEPGAPRTEKPDPLFTEPSAKTDEMLAAYREQQRLPGGQKPDRLIPVVRLFTRDGERMFSGANHGIAYDNAVAELGQAAAAEAAFGHFKKGKMPDFSDNPVDGFLTSDGQFLTRRQAADYVKAREKEGWGSSAMTSEDLDDLRADGRANYAGGGNVADAILAHYYGGGRVRRKHFEDGGSDGSGGGDGSDGSGGSDGSDGSDGGADGTAGGDGMGNDGGGYGVGAAEGPGAESIGSDDGGGFGAGYGTSVSGAESYNGEGNDAGPMGGEQGSMAQDAADAAAAASSSIGAPGIGVGPATSIGSDDAADAASVNAAVAMGLSSAQDPSVASMMGSPLGMDPGVLGMANTMDPSPFGPTVEAFMGAPAPTSPAVEASPGPAPAVAAVSPSPTGAVGPDGPGPTGAVGPGPSVAGGPESPAPGPASPGPGPASPGQTAGPSVASAGPGPAASTGFGSGFGTGFGSGPDGSLTAEDILRQYLAPQQAAEGGFIEPLPPLPLLPRRAQAPKSGPQVKITPEIYPLSNSPMLEGRNFNQDGTPAIKGGLRFKLPF